VRVFVARISFFSLVKSRYQEALKTRC